MIQRLAFLILLLNFLPCAAQNLRIDKEVTLLQTNVYASRNSRNDDKGNPCAVIMVRSSEPNLEFSGNVCGNVAYENATYYVYLPAGSTHLTVSNGSKNKLTLKFKGLASKTTYEAIVLETSDKGSLSLTTNPSGANVYLYTNDEKIPLGKTPIKNTVAIKTGTYRIEIIKTGYRKWEKKDIKISKDKTTDLGKIKLKPF